MTEKNYNPEQKDSKAMKKQQKTERAVKKEKVKEEKIAGVKEKTEEKKDESKKVTGKPEEKKTEKKQVKKIKKTEAFVDVKGLPISTRHSMAICKFIKRKTPAEAINYLEQVVLLKKAIPMKGEIPHRKGMMSGRYPAKAAGYFIKLLKNLQANASVNELNEVVITEAVSNMASRPYGRFGRTKKKRTHIYIQVKEKKNEKKEI